MEKGKCPGSHSNRTFVSHQYIRNYRADTKTRSITNQWSIIVGGMKLIDFECKNNTFRWMKNTWSWGRESRLQWSRTARSIVESCNSFAKKMSQIDLKLIQITCKVLKITWNCSKVAIERSRVLEHCAPDICSNLKLGKVSQHVILPSYNLFSHFSDQTKSKLFFGVHDTVRNCDSPW